MKCSIFPRTRSSLYSFKSLTLFVWDRRRDGRLVPFPPPPDRARQYRPPMPLDDPIFTRYPRFTPLTLVEVWLVRIVSFFHHSLPAGFFLRLLKILPLSYSIRLQVRSMPRAFANNPLTEDGKPPRPSRAKVKPRCVTPDFSFPYFFLPSQWRTNSRAAPLPKGYFPFLRGHKSLKDFHIPFLLSQE